MAGLLWREKTPAVVVSEMGPLSLVRIGDYARIHNVDPRTVIAAITENRLKPEAFPVPHVGLPVSVRAMEDRWLVCVGAVISAREDGTGKVP